MSKIPFKLIIAWLLSILLGLVFIVDGWPKVIPDENMIRRMASWGYGVEFTIFVGVSQILGGLMAFWPKTALYGAFTMGVIMIGAIYTHWATEIGDPSTAYLYLGTAVVIMVLRYKDTYWTPSFKAKN